MTNDEVRRNDKIRMSKKQSSFAFVIWAFWLPSTLGIRTSSFLSLVDHILVSIRIVNNRHPADWCLAFVQEKLHSALLQFVNRRIHVGHLKGNSCALITRRPFRINVCNCEDSAAYFVLDPFSSCHFFARLETKNIFVKCAGALHICHRRTCECYFVDHLLQLVRKTCVYESRACFRRGHGIAPSNKRAFQFFP